MELTGRIHHGVVVLEGGVSLPEGMRVVVYAGDDQMNDPAAIPPMRKRVELPLVHSDPPGTLKLTNDMIAEVLGEDDALPG